MKFVYLLFLFNVFSYTIGDREYDLRNKLFENYNNNIIPSNDSLKLNIGIEIKNLEYFDQRGEKIKFNI